MSSKSKQLLISHILLFVWMGVIFLLSAEVSDVSSGRSDFFVEALQSAGAGWSTDTLQFLIRKAAHIFAYIILGMLSFNVVRQYKRQVKTTLLISALIPALYAITDEVHQMFVPGRSGELRDVLIDTIAGIIGVLLIYNGKRMLHKSRQNGKI